MNEMTPARNGGSWVMVPLSIMMFLQYAVWGVWLPYLANYLQGDPANGGLGFTGGQVGWILGLAASIGAVSAPFLAGQVADRLMNAERYLGLLLILGGVVKFLTYYVHDYVTFTAMSVLYSVLYMPTLALTNSIAFAHLNDPARRFPQVRVWGTIGWIVASNAFSLLWMQTDLQLTHLPPFLAGVAKPNSVGLFADALRVSGALAIIYGVWAMVMLPKTPPSRSVEHPLAFLRAFRLWARMDIVVLSLGALLISMIHQVYFIRTGPFLSALGFQDAYVGPIMSIGQFSEIAVLAMLGLLIKRLGFKWTMVLGCACFALRYGIFSATMEESRQIAVWAMLLHGFCYACFFAASFIYVERVATVDVRHSAQTAYGIIILGVGPILAGVYNEWLDTFAQAGEMQWKSLWGVQAGVGAAAALLIALLFTARVAPETAGDRKALEVPTEA